MLNYMNPDSELTLEQGLVEYYASREDLVKGRGPSEEALEFFRCHDAAHVVFGCNTELPHEGMVKMWSFFGTTGGFGLIAGYRSPESKEIYERLELGPIVSTAFKALRFVPQVVLRARRMTKRWPWANFEAHMGQPLREIRREYGIEIVA